MEQATPAPAGAVSTTLRARDREAIIRKKLDELLKRAPTGHDTWSADRARNFKATIRDYSQARTMPKLIANGQALCGWYRATWAEIDPCFGEPA